MAWIASPEEGKCTGDGEGEDVCPVDVYDLQSAKAGPREHGRMSGV